MVPAIDDDAATGVHCTLDRLLADRGLTLARLSELVGVSVVNLSVLKNDRAKAIRFSTLTAICRALDCEIGELLELEAAPEGPAPTAQR
ncbi:helix-turn-helix transcriptional regulator [Plantibacter sp. VKM Ac-2880]|uniref:helix-turn-helix domain-containing protein n=1 Tax=Plantibacter sp. VKM Ac-2880 TaxID=2783827 RepID=UPI001890636B|nr:helix-turn-helix transcriptional regulator [Plantibacter sp. VKM Ac-2880]MBF4569970.1 helix-turn-helix transcriptional regulator [Plantibacter sp. VKM Ac-2880]